jgi:hypothetical protein
MLSRWVTRVGYLLSGLGIVLLTPIPDLLPVDLLIWAESLLRPTSGSMYLRVVPARANYTIELTLLGVGLAFVLVGRFLRRPQ